MSTQLDQARTDVASERPLAHRSSAMHDFVTIALRAIRSVFDLRPKAIIEDLDLLRPIYAKTAAYGHFGRELPEFTWERTDRVDDLRAAAGL